MMVAVRSQGIGVVPSTQLFGKDETVAKALLQIWARVLDVERVELDDDFFALGADSLAAVEVLVEVRKELGVSLPVTALQQAPTVAQFAAALVQPNAYVSDALLVPLQPNGSRPPFFCVHGVGGVAFDFAGLARRCGDDQPFYGIQGHSLDADVEPFERIEDMAACYVEHMRRLQPQGPYFLGGYSFGGSVALEMAQQLRVAGQEVGMLAIMDHTPPPLRYRGPGARWSFVSGFVRNFPLWTLETLRSNSWKQLAAGIHIKGRVAMRKIAALFNRSRGQSGRTDLEAVFDVSGKPEAFVKLLERHYGMLRAYVPKMYPGRIVLFRARVRPLFRLHGDDLGWNDLAAGGAEVILVPGDHWTMLREPRVHLFAQRLTEALARAQETKSLVQ
jgi:thioesterase domain-containing protein/acyl carrier protein